MIHGKRGETNPRDLLPGEEFDGFPQKKPTKKKGGHQLQERQTHRDSMIASKSQDMVYAPSSKIDSEAHGTGEGWGGGLLSLHEKNGAPAFPPFLGHKVMRKEVSVQKAGVLGSRYCSVKHLNLCVYCESRFHFDLGFKGPTQ